MSLIVSIRKRLYRLSVKITSWKLRKIYGMHIGKDVWISRHAILDKSVNPQGIYIGDHVSLSAYALVLSHDKSSDVVADVVIGNNVFIGAYALILPGVHIGNGAIIGSGTVVRKNVPPYAIVIGNPGKVIGFKMTPEEIVEYEKGVYPEEDRIPMAQLERNYNKYFKNRSKEIVQFLN